MHAASPRMAHGMFVMPTKSMTFRRNLAGNSTSQQGMHAPPPSPIHAFITYTMYLPTPSSGATRAMEWYSNPNYFSYGVNTAYYLVKQFMKVAQATKVMIVLGGIITPIIIALGIDISGLCHLSSILD